MHSYENLKREYGNQVSQTIDGPIMFMDHFDLWDLAISLFIITFFGIIFYSWWMMFFLLCIFIGVIPYIKKNNNRGVFLHYFYKRFGVSLPGLFNPQKNKKVSD